MSEARGTASGLLYAFYGDDFTGSTDVLEQVSSNGLEGVLFFAPPTAEMLARFPGCRAIGLAGDSRSQSPGWMTEHLPDVFAALHRIGAPVVHYKTCSTFDSAPHVGSIGRAIELGLAEFGGFCPVIVAAPHLQRFMIGGNLFAAGGGAVHRIDRHPTMRQHPVTPMTEADLMVHLSRQTRLPIGLVDLAAMQSGRSEEALRDQLGSGRMIVFFDGVDESTAREAARLVLEQAPTFAAGSSGLTYGLIREWRSAALLGEPPAPVPPKKVDRVLVVSGSCSPVTEAQLRWAMANGFAAFAMGRDIDVAQAASDELRRGRSVLIYSSLGDEKGIVGIGGAQLGSEIGRLLRRLVRESGIERAVIAGGDTSSHAVAELSLDALTWIRSLAPGAPLCRAHSRDAEIDGLELVLKGGQIGPEDFFEHVRLGYL